MDLYEYQGKSLFARFGIPVSAGAVAETPEEARAAAEQIGGPVVVKAQVLIGGRGKAGGIKLAATPDEAEARARDILGLDIRGHVVRRLWIESASDIAREYYFSITFDRGAKQPLFMLTTQGGMDIEQVAEESPEALALRRSRRDDAEPRHAQPQRHRSPHRRPPPARQAAGVLRHRLLMTMSGQGPTAECLPHRSVSCGASTRQALGCTKHSDGTGRRVRRAAAGSAGR